MASLVEQIRTAGVVGAGGAGFPAHVKAEARVEYIIANGAECEPLVHKDLEVMIHHAAEIVEGLRLMMEATGAPHGVIGLKRKNQAAVEALTAVVKDPRLTIHTLGDFYPSGDEYILVHETTGRLIPPQGIPLDIGVVVNNVETLYNVALAARGVPVTEKFITVAGAVKTPSTFVAPVGMSYRDAIAVAGGVRARGTAVFVGGIMMGRLVSDLDAPITKTCAGVIIMPDDHPLVRRMAQPEPVMHRIGKSACDQCTYCTELCPRYLLGYDVQPHKVMRSLGFTKTGKAFWSQYAALCCACGLCTLYACPENLYPKEACDSAKGRMKEEGIRWSGPMEVKPHAMHAGRRTPLKLLMKKLGVTEYDVPSHFLQGPQQVGMVRLPLQQHIGQPARPLVSKGQTVRAGEPVGEIPPGQLGARVHASISGVITEVSADIVIEAEA